MSENTAPYEKLVDNPFPGDLRLIGSLDSPLLQIGGVSYLENVRASQLSIQITQSYRYPIEILDGSNKLDGETLLSGYKQPRMV